MPDVARHALGDGKLEVAPLPPSRLAAIKASLPADERDGFMASLAPAVARRARLIERDEAIRAVASWLPIISASDRAKAEAVRRELRNYASTRWLRDQTLAAMPADYERTGRAPLYVAFHAADGRPPLGLTQLRNILENTE